MTQSDHRSRFEVNAATLMISSAAASALGFVYWIVAARLFTTSSVGQASTVISAATMLGTVACMALGGMYERFLSSTGRLARRAVAVGVAGIVAAAVVIGAAFSVLSPIDGMLDHVAERLTFPVVVAVFACFAIVDPVLVGLREVKMVAAKNVGIGVLKIGALVPLAGTGAVAIYGSWTALSLVACAAVLTWTLCLGIRPLLHRDHSLPARGTLVRHHGAVFSLMLLGTVAPLTLPLAVFSFLGAEKAAFFNVAFALVTAVSMVITGIGSSFVAEAARPGGDKASTTRRLIVAQICVTLAAGSAMVLIGPLLLRLVGAQYAEETSGYLRLMAVALVPQVFLGTYALLCRLESRLGLLVAVQLVAMACLVAGSMWAIPHWGLTGIGWVFVATETACALLVSRHFVALLRHVLAASTAPSPPGVMTPPPSPLDRAWHR